jgi:hypothetical protein
MPQSIHTDTFQEQQFTPLPIEQSEELTRQLLTMSRPELVHTLKTFSAPFPVDFTDAFLAKQTDDKLRHVLFALCVHCGRLPRQGSIQPRQWTLKAA